MKKKPKKYLTRQENIYGVSLLLIQNILQFFLIIFFDTKQESNISTYHINHKTYRNTKYENRK